MLRRRMIGWLVFCISCFALLLFRLIQIQLLDTETFSKHHVNLIEESVKQRTQELVIDNGRGNFLDRNGELLNNKKINVLVLFPFLKQYHWEVAKVSEITGIPEVSLKQAVKKAKSAFVYGDPEPVELTSAQKKQINDLNIPGVFAVEKKFEQVRTLAEQLIGLTGENVNELQRRYPDKKLSENKLNWSIRA